VLSGEKPLSLAFIQSLPVDVETRFAALYAEARGHIVVKPVSGQVAIVNLVSGLMGVLAGALPARELPVRADRMARGELPTAQRKVG